GFFSLFGTVTGMKNSGLRQSKGKNGRPEGVGIGIVDLTAGKRRGAGLHQLVAGAHDGYSGSLRHGKNGMAEGSDQTENLRVDSAAGGKHLISFLELFSPASDVFARAGSSEEFHSVLRFPGELPHHHRLHRRRN